MSTNNGPQRVASRNQYKLAAGREATRAMIRDSYLRAMSEAVSPDEVMGALRRAIEYADARRDAKSMAKVLELLLSYAVGRPSPFEEGNVRDIDKLLELVDANKLQRTIITITPPAIEEDNDATGESDEEEAIG